MNKYILTSIFDSARNINKRIKNPSWNIFYYLYFLIIIKKISLMIHFWISFNIVDPMCLSINLKLRCFNADIGCISSRLVNIFWLQLVIIRIPFPIFKKVRTYYYVLLFYAQNLMNNQLISSPYLSVIHC